MLAEMILFNAKSFHYAMAAQYIVVSGAVNCVEVGVGQ